MRQMLGARTTTVRGLQLPLPRPTTCGAQSPGDDEDPPATCTEPKGYDGKHAGGTRCGTLAWKNEEER